MAFFLSEGAGVKLALHFWISASYSGNIIDSIYSVAVHQFDVCWKHDPAFLKQQTPPPAKCGQIFSAAVKPFIYSASWTTMSKYTYTACYIHLFIVNYEDVNSEL